MHVCIRADAKTKANRHNSCKCQQLPATSFDKQFQNFADYIKASLQALQNTTDNNLLKAATEHITDQQRVLNESSASLPAYDVRRYQSAIQNFSEEVEKSRLKYAPKPKFSFKGRKNNSRPLQDDNAQKVQEVKPTTVLERESEILELPGSLVIQGNSLSVPCIDVKTHPTLLDSSTVTVVDISDCKIDLSKSDSYTSVTLRNISSCIINAGSSTSSVFIENCADCHVSGEAQQFRLHSSTGCTLQYKCRTGKPVIESCSKMKFRNTMLDDTGAPQETVVDDFSDLSGSRRNWQAIPS